MTDSDVAIKSVLEQLFPARGEPDWNEVMTAANARTTRRARSARRPLAVAVGVALILAVTVVTPLGAEIVHGLGGFSNWITGEPGTPAPKSDQQHFTEANAHSWLGFPKGTQLRHLLTARAGDATITLDGFRSGTSAFCLRLSVTGKSTTGSLECAPLADLRRQDAPVRVLIADRPIGKGTKTSWYGLDRIHSVKLQITAGIAADSVRAVVLTDNHGRHVVPVRSNAFLYIATDPDVGQRVKTVAAETKTGLVDVPFVPVPFAFGGMQPVQSAPTVKVAAPARNGRISWLEQHVPRGQPLSVLPARIRAYLLGYRGGGPRSRILFGRVLTPDPSQPLRVVVTLNASRHGGRPAGVCTALVTKGGGGGGCAPYPKTFATTPFNFTTSGGGSGQFNEVDGIASDVVAKISVLLANGQTLPVALHDNVFAAAVPVAHLPARLVAYDARGAIIGASDPIGGFGGHPNMAPGKAKQLLTAKGQGGAHAELYVGPATGGGECTYVKTYFNKHASGVMVGCRPAAWRGAPVQLGVESEFVSGRVRSDITAVRLEYARGGSTIVHPTRGYVLAVIPPQHLERADRLVRIVGLNSAQKAVGVQTLPVPPKKAHDGP
jgi:hypothetical protein